MTVRRIALALLLLAAASPPPASGADSAAAPAAGSSGPPIPGAAPAPAAVGAPPPLTGRPVPLGECIAAALRENFDVAIAGADAQIAATGVPIENAAFLPAFDASLDARRDVAPYLLSSPDPLSLRENALTLGAGVSSFLRTGATLGLGFETRASDANPSLGPLDPEYASSLTLSFTQPLLKNGGRLVTETPLVVAVKGAEAAAEDRQARVATVVAEVRGAYLAFAAAVRAAEVRREALGLAERLLAQTEARIGAGIAPPIDRLPAEAAVANRQEELIRAEAEARDAADLLKRLMGTRDKAAWDEPILPVYPAEDPAPPADDETFEEAMRRRPEVRAQEARIAASERSEGAARDQVRPALDLSLTAGLSGLSGTAAPDPLAGSGAAYAGTWLDSVGEMVSGDAYVVAVGMRTEIPWRLDRERAEFARARLEASRQRVLADDLKERIRTEIRAARRGLEAALARVAASRVAAAAAEKSREAEERKYELGRSTVIDVLLVQQSLSEANLTRIRALLDAHLARTRLWRAVGTLLEREGIVVR